ncbi:MAG: Rpn family recombination-promoting nuclease/putative transposase [Proteobacteria bacterium]|nr:Rpn family recombination-promoting nuclease/putative transposase [Pseudomonadota bacterium]
MLYKVTLGEEPGYIYFLFEHKSWPDALIHLQLLEYMINIKTQAINLVADIDPKDAVFLASAIALNATLWSGDKKLIEGLNAKGVKYIARTTELIEKLGI